MNHVKRRMAATCGLLMASGIFAWRGASAAPEAQSVVEVRGGTASFDAATNIATISVHGRSSELDARATVREGSDGLALELVEARLPVAIRGIQRPFTMTLIVSRDGAGFRAAGDGIVKLSAYGIEPPSQLGVRTRDEVKLHLDFTARPAPISTARLGGTR